jgi:ABC-2 type transport system permease protein
MNFQKKINIYIFLAIAGLALLSVFFFFRIDLTSEKRYSISQPTKTLLKKANAPLKVSIYLEGDLNPGFTRLKNSAKNLLDEMSVYAAEGIDMEFINPSTAATQAEREQKYLELEAEGMTPTAIYERDKEGKSIQKIVFPWVKMTYGNKTVVVNLLKNIRGLQGEENLNISIENLEFEITDGIRRLINSQVSKIAFIEGHGELNEAETYDISKVLSRYFQIDRGTLATDATILAEYKAIIIAKPTQPFSESDKYIIDQYIMNGGKVLWLMDGVRVSMENLSTTGISPAIALDLNLDDLLFKYGIRIQPVLLQDVQCASVPVNIAPEGAQPQFEPTPWFFAPLLLTSSQHPISKNITEVRSEFVSTIEVVGENNNTKASLLLATSDNTHVFSTPATIDLSETHDTKDKNYFNMSYMPVSVLVEGEFESNFANRMRPKEITNAFPLLKKSLKTRQIFVADGDIIRNETNGIASDSTTLPLGFDRYMNQQFGNRDFIANAVLYLTDDEGWIDLRSRSLKLRLLNKQLVNNERLTIQLVSILTPLLLLAIFAVLYNILRKRKYTK